MLTVLINGRVLTEHGTVQDCAVVIEGSRIVALCNQSDIPAARLHDLAGRTLLPGFIDIQVNGGGGVLFGDDPTVDTLARIARAHAKFGTTGFLPTLISGTLEQLEKAISAVDAAMAAGIPGILGIHIEGPFLNPARKGIHDATNFRDLDPDALAIVTSFKRGKTLVTLAPERTKPEMIAALAAAGVVVSAGHSDATCGEVRIALDHGLTGFTHLFNAMSPLRAREPGMVGAALDDRSSWCGIIADGHHVDPVALRIALAAKGADKLMLVTDAMPSVGADTKSFMLQGRRISIEDGVCRAPDGTLAGSDLDMASAFRNAIQMMRVDLASASNMASSNPAAYLGIDDRIGSIAVGKQASFVLVDEKYAVSEVWIDGRMQ